MPDTNMINNNNHACVQWSKCSTTKGLHHIQMKENHARKILLLALLPSVMLMVR
jgi:hypothetical protein